MAFQKVKGTTDFYPEDKYIQDNVFGKFRNVAKIYNFNEVESPVFEYMDLLTKKSGDEIKSQIFTLEKKSKEELGLRFEFTASFARMFISRQKEVQKPVKWFSIGRVWRYEQPQKGRLREFFQYNCEIYGSKNPECDVEIVNLAIDSLNALGLKSSDFFVRINNRKLLQGLILALTTEDRVNEVLRIIDKKEKITEGEFVSELDFLGKENILKLLELLKMEFSQLENVKMNDLAKEGYDELKAIMNLLDSDLVRFDLSTARGLAYYTGTVFEIFDIDRKYRALCGGGRYDDMIETFGGDKTPATGFGMGYSTVSLLLEEKGLLPKSDIGPDFFIVIIESKDEKENQEIVKGAFRIISELRNKGNSVEFDLNKRNISNQFKYANAIGAKKAVVIGADELLTKVYSVKDIKTGKEEKLKIDEL